jgi:hypothetical protein
MRISFSFQISAFRFLLKIYRHPRSRHIVIRVPHSARESKRPFPLPFIGDKERGRRQCKCRSRTEQQNNEHRLHRIVLTVELKQSSDSSPPTLRGGIKGGPLAFQRLSVIPCLFLAFLSPMPIPANSESIRELKAQPKFLDIARFAAYLSLVARALAITFRSPIQQCNFVCQTLPFPCHSVVCIHCNSRCGKG